ncbi:hypothetical protein ARMGADRAFT_1091092 [Armillaria gallica]|uniref:Uncharacterized protein n=1 Tax=Armillaria gallica TaxID=47427 RepID=A0A2H3CEV8_ARMGA|nr:hypothetical protein ARMGADRAFT_1091092 [Armillaria gallica]
MKRSADQDPDSEIAWREATSTGAAEAAAGSSSSQLAKAPFIPMIVTIDDMDIDPPSNHRVVDDCSMSGESVTEEQDELDSQHSTDLTLTPAAIDVNGGAWEQTQEQSVVVNSGTTLKGLASRTSSNNAMRPSLSRTVDTDLSTAQDGSAENSLTNTADYARDNGVTIDDAIGYRLATLVASGTGALPPPGHETTEMLESEINVGRGSEMRSIDGSKCAAGGELDGEEDDRIQGNTGDSTVVADDPTGKQCITPLDKLMGGVSAMSPSGSMDIAATLQRNRMADTESEIIERSGGKTYASGSEWAGFPELGHGRVAGESSYQISASLMPDAAHDAREQLYKNRPSQILHALQRDDADIAPSEADVDNDEEITDGDILKELHGPRSERVVSKTSVSVRSDDANSAPSEVDINNGYKIDVDNGYEIADEDLSEAAGDDEPCMLSEKSMSRMSVAMRSDADSAPSEIDIDNSYEIADEDLSEVTGDDEPGMLSEKSMSRMLVSMRSDDADSAPSEIDIENGYELDMDNGYEIDVDNGYEIADDDISDVTGDGDLRTPSEKSMSQMSMSMRSDDADSAPSEINIDNGYEINMDSSYEIADEDLSEVTSDDEPDSAPSEIDIDNGYEINMDNGYEIVDDDLSDVTGDGGLRTSSERSIRGISVSSQPHFIRDDAMLMLAIPGLSIQNLPFSHIPPTSIPLSVGDAAPDQYPALNEMHPYIPSRQVDTMELITYPVDLSTRWQVNDDNLTMPPASALFSHHGVSFLSHLGSVSYGSSSHCSSGCEFDEDEGSEIDEDDGLGVNDEAGDSEMSEYSRFLEGLSDGSRINFSPRALSILHEVDDEDFTGAYADREESPYTSFEELDNEGSEIDMSNCTEVDEVSSKQFLDLNDYTDFLMERHSIPSYASAVLPHDIYGESGSKVGDKSGSEIDDKSGSEIFELCDDGLFARHTNPSESNSGHPSSPTSDSHQVPSMHRQPSSRPQKTYHANRDCFYHSTYAGTPQEDVEDFASAINAVSSDEDTDSDQEHRTAWAATDSSSSVEDGGVPARGSNHGRNTNPPPNNGPRMRDPCGNILKSEFRVYVATLDVSIASEGRIRTYEHTMDPLHGPQPEQCLVLDTSDQNIATPWNMHFKELLLDGFLESGGSSLPNVTIETLVKVMNTHFKYIRSKYSRQEALAPEELAFDLQERSGKQAADNRRRRLLRCRLHGLRLYQFDDTVKRQLPYWTQRRSLHAMSDDELDTSSGHYIIKNPAWRSTDHRVIIHFHVPDSLYLSKRFHWDAMQSRKHGQLLRVHEDWDQVDVDSCPPTGLPSNMYDEAWLEE